MIAWFLSDLHLKTMKERNSQKLLRFLHSLPLQVSQDQNPHLFLLGDIFDLWVSDHSIFVQEFNPIVEAIRQLVAHKFRVIYFEGNHDMHIDKFWTHQLGVEVFEEAAYFDFNGFVIRAEHGDLINLNDEKYLKSRKLLRTPWMEFLGHFLPGRFWKWYAGRASEKSRARSSQYRANNKEIIVEMIRSHAKKVIQEKPFDLILSGHMHVFDDYEFTVGSKKARSINLGSWLEEPRVLVLNDKKIHFLTSELV